MAACFALLCVSLRPHRPAALLVSSIPDVVTCTTATVRKSSAKHPLLFVKDISHLKLIGVVQSVESFQTNTDGDTFVSLIYIQYSPALSTTHHLVSHSCVYYNQNHMTLFVKDKLRTSCWMLLTLHRQSCHKGLCFPFVHIFKPLGNHD